jgi:hypothetical protein
MLYLQNYDAVSENLIELDKMWNPSNLITWFLQIKIERLSETCTAELVALLYEGITKLNTSEKVLILFVEIIVNK